MSVWYFHLFSRLLHFGLNLAMLCQFRKKSVLSGTHVFFNLIVSNFQFNLVSNMIVKKLLRRLLFLRSNNGLLLFKFNENYAEKIIFSDKGNSKLTGFIFRGSLGWFGGHKIVKRSKRDLFILNEPQFGAVYGQVEWLDYFSLKISSMKFHYRK